MTRARFYVPGKPVPMARPRVTRFGTYHPKSTTAAKAEVVFAWQAAGGVAFDDIDVSLEVLVVVPRPKTHLLRSGDLSAAGKASPSHPRGDVDNYLKLVMDALNGRAWHDDVQVVEATVLKAWSHYGVSGGLYVEAAVKSASAQRLDSRSIAGRHVDLAVA